MATAEDEWTMRCAKTEINRRVAREIALAACLAGGCMLAGTLAKAQAESASRESGSNSRLLSIEEGRMVAEAARDQDLEASGAADCSHLVHQTYLRAGFAYPYASSFELYAGNKSFARVKNPHPGDLIVWPGHAGIVVDPKEHEFYSLVSTGLEAQDYEGTYWRSRGRPRFYRYKVEDAEILTTVRPLPLPRSSNSTNSHNTGTLIEGRSSVADSSSNRPPKPARERTKIGNGQPAPAVAVVASIAVEIPQSIVIASGDKRPTLAQVAEGISELSKASGNILRAEDPLRLALPVVIFERLRVERLELKRNHGWASLLIDSRATIVGGVTEQERRREKVRWELRRTDSGWEAITPTDRAYVPNDVAVRNLAALLAQLTARDGAGTQPETLLRQESQLANLLSTLLENK